jgi:hypothetical protein
MRGHIRPRGPDKWQLACEAGLSPAGNRRQAFKTFYGSKRATQRELANLIASINTRIFLHPCGQATRSLGRTSFTYKHAARRRARMARRATCKKCGRDQKSGLGSLQSHMLSYWSAIKLEARHMQLA